MSGGGEIGRRRVRRVKLMADYWAFPLWAVPEDEGNLSDPFWAGGLSPESLPLSAPLIADLQKWAETHDRLLGPTFEWPSEQARILFVAEGRRLLVRVREELGSGYEVVYFDEITGLVSDEEEPGRAERPGS